jgi:hypothetical protein
MKLFSQQGFGDGNKTNEGLRANYIQGIILRPRDIQPDRIGGRYTELHSISNDCEVLFDPQVYAGVLFSNPNLNLGKLEEYNHVSRVILSRLESEQNIISILRQSLEYQASLQLDGVIAPNIMIRRSFDSREAVIAKNFLRLAKGVHDSINNDRPLYSSIVVHRDALSDRNELQEFLNDITTLEEKPDGFYVTIGANSSDARAEIFSPDVVSGWMLINYSLKVNGFRVINGYSDMLSPLLAAIGGDAGATGWWSNTRVFSLDQFVQSVGGGRLPIQRYLSKALFNRIRFDELRAWRGLVPEIVNGLATDSIYADDNEEPERAREVLQSWEALNALNTETARGNIQQNIELCERLINQAVAMYDRIESFGLRPDQRSNRDHLEPLREGIRLFRQIAEV